jgi:hypothetical protein
MALRAAENHDTPIRGLGHDIKTDTDPGSGGATPYRAGSTPAKFGMEAPLCQKRGSIPFAQSGGECDFASRTWRADVNHDKMVKLDLRDSELRALSDSEGIYSV